MSDSEFNKSLPLVNLSTPKSAQLGYISPNPEAEKAKQEATEAKKKYLLNQKPEEARKHVQSGNVNLESVYSAFFLASYLYDELVALKKTIAAQNPNENDSHQKSKNDTGFKGIWSTPIPLGGVIMFILSAITLPLCILIFQTWCNQAQQTPKQEQPVLAPYQTFQDSLNLDVSGGYNGSKTHSHSPASISPKRGDKSQSLPVSR